MITAWHINRLKAMPLSEVVLRLYRKIRAKVWFFALPHIKTFEKLFSLELKEKDWLFNLKETFPVSLSKDTEKLYKKDFSVAQCLKAADQVLEGKIPVFGFTYDTEGGLPDWHKDPLSVVSWPKVFFDKLNHNDLRYGRLLNVWELNRHLYLYDLGKAFFLTEDRRYADCIVRHISDWIEHNPVGIGINWYSSMEMAIRSISWLWALFFIVSKVESSSELIELIPESIQQRILRSIFWQAYFIEKNLSKYSFANNHLIGEAVGLFFVGSVLPFLPRSDTWKKKGWRILCDEIPKQIFPDGVPKEQSNAYLFFVFDLCTIAILLAKKQFLDIPETFLKRLENACEYIMYQIDHKGNVPNIGDSSDACVLKLHSGRFNPYCSMLNTGAIFFKRSDFKYWAGEIDERNFWLFSEEGLKLYKALPSEPGVLSSKLFQHGGQIILRHRYAPKEEAIMWIDGGPFGYLYICAHAHADALSFTLNVSNNPILIDPGTYLYHDGGKWRDYFRSTRAHNTIEVDGKDQADSGGPFLWLTRADSFIKKFDSDPEKDVLEIEHNGYKRLKDPVVHRRYFVFNKRRLWWMIKDEIICKGKHQIIQAFHFHPKCVVKRIDEHMFQIEIQNVRLFVKLDPKLSCSLYRGEIEPIFGWYSDKFGEKEPCFTLVGRWVIPGSQRFSTYIWKDQQYG